MYVSIIFYFVTIPQYIVLCTVYRISEVLECISIYVCMHCDCYFCAL